MGRGMDTLIDLHLHTTYSDGHWVPRSLFDQLAECGIAIASVVDHDQLDHLPEVLALGAERGITVIPGTEVTASWRGTAAHFLCYAPPASGFTSDALRSVVNLTRAAMLANTTMIYQTLRQRGYDFPRQSELLAAQGGQPVRAGDVARLLLESRHVATQEEAMAMVIEAGYRQATAPLAEVVEAAHASGALCLLAHPGRSDGEIHRFEPEEIEKMLRDVPLDGVEVYYPTHSEQQIAAYMTLARRHDLLISVGSDSHGPRQRLPVAYPAAHVSALLARLDVTPG
jgi:3',5'-nucleoside bisphosphate phosphatase